MLMQHLKKFVINSLRLGIILNSQKVTRNIRDLEPLEFPMKDSFMLTEKGTDISGSSWFSCCGGATTEQIPTSQEENTGWFSGWW